jgi:hypothetical protein
VSGAAAGAQSTASAVVSDIVAAARAPAEPPPLPADAVTIGDPAAVERGGYVRVRLARATEAEQLVVQALEDRGIPVLASTVVEVAGGAAQLALITASAPREMLDHAAETLDSLAAVDSVASVMDCVGPPV